MGKFLVALLVVCGTLMPALAATADRAPAATNPEQQRVLAVEDAYAAAEVSRDEVALTRIVDDRFVYNGNDGKTFGKPELIAHVLTLKMSDQTLSERTVLIEGDLAMIFGTADLRFATDTGEETKSLLRYTSVYVNRDGQWRMLGLQMAAR